MNLTILIQFIFIGILLGGVYAMIAAGLTLILGVMKILNFAHGEYLMIAMFLTYFLNKVIGMDPYLTLIIGIPFMFLCGVITYKIIVNPVLLRGQVNQLLVTIGLSFFLQNLSLTLFTSNLRNLALPYSGSGLFFGGIVLGMTRVYAFIGSICVIFAIYFMLRHTEFGRKVQATAQNRDAASLMGINVDRVYLVSFAIGIASVGVAGCLLTPFCDTYPQVGSLFLLTAFFVVVLGGMENLMGSLIGGLLVGITESVSSIFMPGTTSPIIVFCLFIIILLFKPEGLLGRRALRS